MKKLLLGLSLLVLGFGCARQSDNSTNQNANLYGQYQVNATGQCVAVQTQAPVQQNLCQQNGQMGQYQLNAAGQCVMIQTQAPVQQNLCQQTNLGYAQQCYGYYSYQGVVYGCGITHNCSSYTVTNVQTGQQVLCQ